MVTEDMPHNSIEYRVYVGVDGYLRLEVIMITLEFMVIQ
jgi:hypothetical protein